MVMQTSDLPFQKGDYVEVDGGYVNCICIATRSHLHPKTPTSYFTLTIEGTENTPRAVNVCIPEFLWDTVKVITPYNDTPKS